MRSVAPAQGQPRSARRGNGTEGSSEFIDEKRGGTKARYRQTENNDAEDGVYSISCQEPRIGGGRPRKFEPCSIQRRRRAWYH